MIAKPDTLSSRERNDLLVMIRQRATIAKSLASQRAAELVADFDQQMATYYSFLDDDVWKEAVDKAHKVAEAANAEITQRCQELKIPKRFAPRLTMPYWVDSDAHYMTKSEKKDLRDAAKSRIEALRKVAITEITRRSIEAQEKVIVPGLTSPLAQQLLTSIPSVTDLMPTLSIQSIAKLIGKEQQDEPG
jgi:hypothetical protein